jgi:hypothetical protein
LYGDKILNAVALSLYQKYGIPHSWCNALRTALSSGVYQRKISESKLLCEHLFHPQGRKIHADAFEV